MEFTGNNEYASKGVGTAGLTLGIIGTALATLAGGGSLLNANNRSNGNGNGGSNGGAVGLFGADNRVVPNRPAIDSDPPPDAVASDHRRDRPRPQRMIVQTERIFRLF